MGDGWILWGITPPPPASGSLVVYYCELSKRLRARLSLCILWTFWLSSPQLQSTCAEWWSETVNHATVFRVTQYPQLSIHYTTFKRLRWQLRVIYRWAPPIPSILVVFGRRVMVIVWRLRGNIIRTVLYIANVLPLQWAPLTKTVHTARLGLEFVFLCFLGCMICLCWCMFCFTLDSWVTSLHVVALA